MWLHRKDHIGSGTGCIAGRQNQCLSSPSHWWGPSGRLASRPACGSAGKNRWHLGCPAPRSNPGLLPSGSPSTENPWLTGPSSSPANCYTVRSADRSQRGSWRIGLARPVEPLDRVGFPAYAAGGPGRHSKASSAAPGLRPPSPWL